MLAPELASNSSNEELAAVISIADHLPEGLDPQLRSLLHSHRYAMWKLGMLALSAKEAAILRSAPLLEV